MNVGTRHPSVRRRGLSAFASMSLIALLALVCLPVSVQADSSGVQYSDDLPRAEGENTPTRKKEPTAKSSIKKDGGSPVAETPDDSEKSMGEGEKGGSSESGGVPVGGDNGDRGQGSPGGSAKGSERADAQPSAQAKGTQASDDDGSSPLIPILAAILALAAISVAAVMVRQRRQGGGSAGTAPSPKAS
jgi:hypothetical protein